MLHIAICEDEQSQLLLLENLVKDWAARQKTEVRIDPCSNAGQVLFLREEKDIDILLLDIEMPGMDGISLAHRLREKGENLQIIFVTGSPDYVLEGYEVEAVSYLLKPVNRERMFACLDRAVERGKKEEPVLLLEMAGQLVKVKIREICYVESVSHDTLVYLQKEKEPVRCRTGIAQLTERIEKESDAFYKIHRSFLVNLAYIGRITRKDVEMEDGRTLPIARGKWEELNRAYLQFYRGRQDME